eukprot:5635631-Pyramimonas_sp.AAC.1
MSADRFSSRRSGPRTLRQSAWDFNFVDKLGCAAPRCSCSANSARRLMRFSKRRRMVTVGPSFSLSLPAGGAVLSHVISSGS